MYIRARRAGTRTVTARAALAIALLLGLVALAPAEPAQAAGGGVVDLSGAVANAFAVSPGVETATVTGVGAGDHVTLIDPVTDEREVTLFADDHGQANFAYVPDTYVAYATGTGEPPPTSFGHTLKPGTYRIVDESVSPVQVTAPFHVLSVDENPDPTFYDGKTIGPGFQYVTMRDGVQLSIMVRFPDPNLYGPGPYPTVVEYSGYGPSDPASPEPGTMIAGLVGFATVGVNMRGSGCSGGVFDVFNPAQFADAYDVIETVARQTWVLHNKVGMVGISYSGISQLFAASTRPPHLAAITPLSVIEDPWFEQWPGGVYNEGFTASWLAQRDAENAPHGNNWVNDQITSGDMTCAANVQLHEQNPDFQKFAQSLEFRPADADERRLAYLVPNIDVPVFLTGGWQDEQTGAKFASMLNDFTDAPVKRFTMFNGRHPDGFTPLVLSRWLEFLQLYVAQQVPHVPDFVRAIAPAAFEQAFHVAGLGFEPDRFASFGNDYAGARAAYEAEQPVRVLFENGAGLPGTPGAPVARGEASFPSWPPPEATARTFYLGDRGTLGDAPPSTQTVERFQYDPSVDGKAYSDTSSSDFLFPQIDVNWQPTAPGKGLSYLTDPLPSDMVVTGPGHLDLWVRSTATDADLEVVMTEVYPDGHEVAVQEGLLRAGDRSVDPTRSDQFQIEHNYDLGHYQALPADQFTFLQIPLFSVAHPFRAGSRLRITIDTPGGNLPIWSFINPSFGTQPVFDDVAHGPTMPSKLVLPVTTDLPSTAYPADRPPCGSLRGQVCRDYVPLTNEVVATDATEPTTTAAATSSPTTAPPPSSAPTTSSTAPVVAAEPAFTG
jgi:predicted acyl esterase